MGVRKAPLRLDEKVKAENRLYAFFFHVGEQRIWWTSVAAALALHVLAGLLPVPKISGAALPILPVSSGRPLVVRKYLPPPPAAARPQVRPPTPGPVPAVKLPIPDPTPEAPEPVREPAPELAPEALPPDIEVVLGTPELPPATGPLIAGAEGVSFPELIPESRIEPEYPEKARRARLEGNVILQAVILKDGTAGEIAVLRCNRPGVGFEESAIEAVRLWRYRPARQNGRAVDVYFTVKVDFVLR